ncbi:MAG: T9SS type A sorting domain-containing protein [Crocinitomicaceae bacterium]|nr:T9SS type A sorting domain-containing protein [Flavobacteriales bacterium]NQZ34062.1 T9SS type A sorting domain-containing protein [Crocinitomicaceae bacterium]
MRFLICLFLSLSALVTNAQLSGTYTIGGSLPDYTTVSSAVADLHLQGVSSPVVFSIRNGTYFEKPVFTSWTGMTSLNPVTFESESGDSSLVVLHYYGISNTDIPLTIYGADYLIFKSITLMSDTLGNFRKCADLTNSANGIEFQNCSFIGSTQGNNVDESLVTLDGGSGTLFDNCRFENGWTAVYIADDYFSLRNNHSIITNCEFYNFIRYGIYGLYIGDITIQDNYMSTYNMEIPQCIFFYDINGICTITGNEMQMHRDYLGYGALKGISTNDAAFAPGSLIANNMINIIGGSTSTIGINLVGNGVGIATLPINVDIVYNTVRIITESECYCPGFRGGHTGTRILNNIFFSENSTYPLTASGTSDSVDYNILYTDGTQDWSTLWFLGPNNYSVNPGFVSTYDPHVPPHLLSNYGSHFPGVLVDIDGEPRDPLTPDIGADETVTLSLDAAITEIVTPMPNGHYCGPIDSILVVLGNVGTTPLTSSTITLTVDGVPVNSINWSGTLLYGESDTINVGAYPFLDITTYDISIYSSNPNGGIDQEPWSDTISILDFQIGLSGLYTLGGATPDFNTFKELETTLMTAGVCGPVTVNVRDGSYYDYFHLKEVEGLSGSNTLTIQGESSDSSLVELWADNSSGVNYTLFMEDVAYITFKHMKIRNGGAINNRVVKITRVHDMTFESVIVQGYSCNNCSAQTINAFTGSDVDSNLILNKVRIFTIGSDLVLFANDNLGSAARNFVITNSIIGYFDIYDCHDLIMKNNTIGGGFSRFQDCGYMEIERNNFRNAIAMYSCGSPTATSYFRNNTIYSYEDGGASNSWDWTVYLYGTGNMDVYHNTIKAKGTTRCIYLRGTNLNVHNNIFYQEDAANSLLTNAVSSVNVVSENNLYWAPNNVNPDPLTYVQNFYGLDTSSFLADPMFLTNVDSTFWPTNPIVDNLGLSSWGLPEDFYGSARGQYGDLGAIEQLFPPAVDLGVDTSLCSGDVFGITDNGYSYLWNTGDTTSQLIADTSGTYILTITNSIGTATDTINVTVYSIPSVSLVDSVSLCFGDSVILEVNQSGLSYDWSNGDTDSIAVFYGTQIASVIVTNLGGCSATDSITIIEHTEIQMNVLSTDETCLGDEDGQVELEILAGEAPIDIAWSHTASSDTIFTNLPADNYLVTLTDVNGCTAQDSAEIQPGIAYPTVSLIDSVFLCFGDSVLLEVNQSGLTYNWSNGDVDSLASFSGTQTAVVIVANSAGCADTAATYITEFPEVQINLLHTNETCYGDLNGELELEVLSAASPYTISWSHTTSVDTVFTNLVPSEYFVMVTDSNGCFAEDSATIQQGSVFLSNIGAPTIVCQFDTITLLGLSFGPFHDWFVDGNFVSNTTNLEYICSVGGTFNVMLVASSGTCSDTSYANLNIGTPNSGTDSIAACESYTWIDGNTYTSSNNAATFIVTNASGCDSLVTLNLILNNSTAGTDVITACDDYTWIDGNTYTSSNNSATFTLTNATGCDSLVTLDLTINQVNTTVTNNDPILEAIAGASSYQWLDCNNGYAPISGETSSSFNAQQNGLYAVEVESNGCIDTSACFVINQVELDDLITGNWEIYPNPTSGVFTINFNEELGSIKIRLTNSMGQLIQESTSENVTEITMKLGDEPGLYFVHIWEGLNHRVIPVVKL